MPRPVKTRAYDSTRRREAARRTRKAILAAARDLFTEHGYAATSVQAVADRAGVSLDTVYASVGRKPQLLLAVHDMELAEGPVPVPAEQRGYVRAVLEAPTAREKLRRYSEAMARLLPRTVPLMVALREAGATDAACRDQYAAFSDRRAANMRLLAADLRATGELRAGLDDAWVADLIWSMNSPDYFRLMADRGYDPERFASLLLDVWIRTLLADDVAP